MEKSKVPTADVMSLLDMLERKVLSIRLAKDVLVTMAAEGKTPDEVISEVAMQGKPPSEEHTTLVRGLIDAILDQGRFVDQGVLTYDRLIKMVMRYTAGKAHPMAIKIVLKEKEL